MYDTGLFMNNESCVVGCLMHRNFDVKIFEVQIKVKAPDTVKEVQSYTL